MHEKKFVFFGQFLGVPPHTNIYPLFVVIYEHFKGTTETMRKRKGRRDDDDDDDDDENARVLSDDSLSPSSLWEAIVKWDDVSFKHILPRLDLNDVKFLYGVNTETRKKIRDHLARRS